MIEVEIREIIKDPQRLARFADEFRRGRENKIIDLLALLNADNEEIVRIGAWIAGEVKIDPTSAQPLISRLQQLVNHKEPMIRFYTIGALFPFLDWSDPVVREMLVRLSADPNKGVRMSAQAALTRLAQM
jgi:hypothetical protein